MPFVAYFNKFLQKEKQPRPLFKTLQTLALAFTSLSSISFDTLQTTMNSNPIAGWEPTLTEAQFLSERINDYRNSFGIMADFTICMKIQGEFASQYGHTGSLPFSVRILCTHSGHITQQADYG